MTWKSSSRIVFFCKSRNELDKNVLLLFVNEVKLNYNDSTIYNLDHTKSEIFEFFSHTSFLDMKEWMEENRKNYFCYAIKSYF
jgi:hypothetical protein